MADDLRARAAQLTDDELRALERDASLDAGQLAIVREELRIRVEGEPGSEYAPVSVVVRDFDMPFTSVMLFMVKWAVASIPAVIILLTVAILTAGLLVGFLREFR